MPWQNAGTPIQALGLVKRTGFDARTASRPANTQTVLNNVSLDIDGAGLTAIVGPSGAGKTSLLYVLSGLDRPDSGRVTIGGTDVYALNEERRSRFIRGHIGFVFQQYNLVPYLTVEENVMLPLSLAHRKADYVQVTQLLSRFGLRQRAKTTVSALSGGEQQRVALRGAQVPADHRRGMPQRDVVHRGGGHDAALPEQIIERAVQRLAGQKGIPVRKAVDLQHDRLSIAQAQAADLHHLSAGNRTQVLDVLLRGLLQRGADDLRSEERV